MDKEEKTKSVADELKNKQVKTYAEDMAKVIESDSGGLIKKIIHQQEQYEIERKNSSPRSKKNQLFIFTGIVLVFLAIVLLVSLGPVLKVELVLFASICSWLAIYITPLFSYTKSNNLLINLICSF